MFKLRLLSTLVLLPLAVAGILYLPNILVALLSGILISMAAWEWLHMGIMKHSKIRFFLLVALIIFAGSLLALGFNSIWLFYLALVWWVLAFIAICYYPTWTQVWHEFLLQPLVGLILFVPGWLAFNAMHAQRPNGPIWVLLGCALIWGSDMGAYCFGKLFGKDKLAPHVSPNKTFAGLYGAFLTGAVIMLGFYFVFQPQLNIYYALWLALITVGFAVIGDLFESMLKRVYGVKDSGNIIPGHGGILDRIDSMLAAFPVYFLCLNLLQLLRLIEL